MKRIIYILFVFIIGVVTAPVTAFACSAKTENPDTKQNCIKEDKNSECSKNCKHNKTDCPGKYGEKACKCPTLNQSSVIAIFPQTDKNICYLSANKVESTNHKTYLLSGFYFIWSPPHIS